MATKNLLQEFPAVSTEQWEKVIARDLKGADYAKKLLWKADDGLTVKPYYRQEDLAEISFLDAAPGEFPYVRGTHATAQWRIREEIEEHDPAVANRLAREAVAAGTEEVAFVRPAVANANDVARLLEGIRGVPIHFLGTDTKLLTVITKADLPSNCSSDFDPIGDPELAAAVLSKLPPSFHPFSIHGWVAEDSGSTIVQELGYTLAAGIDYLAAMTQRGIDVNRAAGALTFSLAIGASYFFQIAKFRALRLLWARAVESFGGGKEHAKAVIFARTSRWNKTIYDPHVNVLRETTEAMSAALGGADAISVAPFDESYATPDDASRRLARNTQIILKEEAQLARVADPGGGSYYLEVITDFFAREAWKKMQSIETAGGFTKFKADGLLYAEIGKSRAEHEKAINTRRRTLVGTNQYPNPKETALDRINLERVHSGYRGARAFEDLRLRTEQYVKKGGKNPRFLLAEIGDPRMRSARSNFAANFFGCAGFDIITERFESVGAIAGAEAEVIVLCSSDPEYPALASELIGQLKKAGRKTPVIVAGYPESVEQLKAAGVADFIHIRSNPIETLASWQQRLQIGN